MKLTIDQIKSITTGAADIVYEDQKYKFLRFVDGEHMLRDNNQVFSTAGIQMNFKTDGRLLKLAVHTSKITNSREFFSFDIFVNETMVGTIQNMTEEECVGNYSEKTYTTGSFEGEFELGHGEKHVRIYFPHSVMGCIEEIEIVDAAYIVPVKRSKTIVAYGDSITQGFDALHPSNTYISKLGNIFDADIVNRAVGGVTFCPEVVSSSNDINPCFVIVAYGTNDWYCSDQETLRKNAEDFLNAIEQNYRDVPIFVVTPIWRTDWNSEKKCGKISDVVRIINEVFEHKGNITIISGCDLVPHDENLYGDLRLHPTDRGFVYYCNNLVENINKKTLLIK